MKLELSILLAELVVFVGLGVWLVVELLALAHGGDPSAGALLEQTNGRAT